LSCWAGVLEHWDPATTTVTIADVAAVDEADVVVDLSNVCETANTGTHPATTCQPWADR
jgi:hypothetical protein